MKWLTPHSTWWHTLPHRVIRGQRRKRPDPFVENLSEAEPALVRELFEAGVAEAAGGFPGYLLDLAQQAVDAPGCSPIAVA
jgi:hypothetical protein